MGSLIENISTIIVAFSAFVTAGATIVLAVITKRYVRLTQGILKATNKPKVILFLRHSRYSIRLCVQNIGTGYASDVDSSGDLFSFKTIPTVSGDDGTLLKDLEPYKSGINYLGPGYKIDTVKRWELEWKQKSGKNLQKHGLQKRKSGLRNQKHGLPTWILMPCYLFTKK